MRRGQLEQRISQEYDKSRKGEPRQGEQRLINVSRMRTRIKLNFMGIWLVASSMHDPSYLSHVPALQLGCTRTKYWSREYEELPLPPGSPGSRRVSEEKHKDLIMTLQSQTQLLHYACPVCLSTENGTCSLQ